MRDGLYESHDLLRGYDPARPASFLETWDFRQFIAFTASGGPLPAEAEETRRQARHDADISIGLGRYLKAQTGPGCAAPRLVAIMGSHVMERGSSAYRLAADVGRALTSRGFLVATGGGPGAMEAGHVGAWFAHAPEPVYLAALARLAACPTLPPELNDLIDPSTGDPLPHREAAYAAVAAWLNAALEARAMLPAGVRAGESVAIPTWFYGTEPTTVFASVYAKYFQNALREETLVAEGKTGTVYTRGGGGTLREIFQGVEHNCYVQAADDFLPMIFADPDGYWQTDPTFDAAGEPTRRGVNLSQAIPAILKVSLPPALWAACADKVRFTDDLAEISEVLTAHAPPAESRLGRMLDGDPAGMLSAWMRPHRE
jgi:predicted Rossmann-fold nucleotide-binding protein